MLKVIARAACNDSRLKAFARRADFWGYSWWTRKRWAEYWRESGVVRTREKPTVEGGEKQTVEGGAKQRSSSRCVTNYNPNPANDRSLLLLSGVQRARTKNSMVHRFVYVNLDSVKPSVTQTIINLSNQRREKRFVTQTIWSVTHRSWLVPNFNHIYNQ